MARINTTQLKHFSRNEEKDILTYVDDHNNYGHISVFGLSGTGKTEMLTQSIKFLHDGDYFSGYTVLHYDAVQITTEYTKECFYNLLIYKLLQKSVSQEINQTYVTEQDTFLAFLEKSTYKEEIKYNAKKSLITSLSLLPTVGPLIYKLLDINEDNISKDYHTNQFLFNEYLNYLSINTGIILFIDNIQQLPYEIIVEFYEILRQLEGRVLLFTSYTLKKDECITSELVNGHMLYKDSLILNIENLSLELFEKICKQNVSRNQFLRIKERLTYYYELVQNGNMREINEFIFQIKWNGLESINETPTLQAIKVLDEIKKDIITLTILFPEGIKSSLIERIVKYNHSCTELQIQQSISNLNKMNYILVGENNTLKVEHEKIMDACRLNLESSNEEEKFIDLIYSCRKVFTDIVYEPIDDSDFVFCVNGLLEFEKQFDFIKHLGILRKYIDILYRNFKYFQICHIYRNLSQHVDKKINIALFFPIMSIMQFLDSFQKTSAFKEGLEICDKLTNYYNLDLYTAKFLLQSYHYKEAISVLEKHLNNYESWSIYLNTLQHLRHDDEVKQKIQFLINNKHQYLDIEYYYIILRNSGHLFEFDEAMKNLQQSLTYFNSLNNTFVESTCLNNIGILFLYKGQETENVNTARSYFTKAQSIMKDLMSNEEYQSIINIGVSYLCENNPNLALEYFECAKNIMPNNLTFEIIKLECNIIISKYILKEEDILITRKKLLDLCSKSENLPDPWIKLLCIYNLSILRNDNDVNFLNGNYPGNINLYGLILNNPKLKHFMIGISPHWRY